MDEDAEGPPFKKYRSTPFEQDEQDDEQEVNGFELPVVEEMPDDPEDRAENPPAEPVQSAINVDDEGPNEAKRLLSQYLYSLSKMERPSNGSIEVEVRLGYSQERIDLQQHHARKEFVPGISKEDFDLCLMSLLKKGMQHTHEMQTDFFYEVAGVGRVRLTYDQSETQLICALRKTRAERPLDLEIPSLPYDCRVGISIEEKVDLSRMSLVREEYDYKRTKNRYSFVDSYASWRIDLTEAKHIIRGAEDEEHETVYEVEFEFTEDTIKGCSKDNKTVAAIAHKFWNFLHEFTSRFGAAEAHSQFKGLRLQKVEWSATHQFRGMCARACRSDDNNSSKNLQFPGSMPVNFSRKSIPLIQKKPYYISEKTDGIRYMMLVIRGKGVFIADRKFDFFQVLDFDGLDALLAPDDFTLLDGEMVVHAKDNKPMFLIFDAIVLNGESLVNENLTKRLETIRNKVVLPYRHAIETDVFKRQPPFTIIGKQFFPKKAIRTLFQNHIREEHGERYYVDDKRHHKTDGVIFTPDDKYQPKTCQTLFKWKYIDMWSIDLKVGFNAQTNRISFSCLGTHGYDVPYDLALKQADYNRLLSDISVQRNRNNIIVECSFDHWSGDWKYLKIRSDKVKANFIKIVFDTLEAICENIPKEELLYRVPIDPVDDHWRQAVQEYMKKLVHPPVHQKHPAPQGQHGASHAKPSVAHNHTA